MKKLFLIIAICMGAITAQGKDRLEQTVPVTQFDKVSLTAGFIVNYTQGMNHECTIFASPKDMEHINIDNVDAACQKTVLSIAGAGKIKKDGLKITGKNK